MTRMTETVTGEVNFYKPMVGTEFRDIYDRARSGEIVTEKEASSMVRFGMDFECVEPYKSWRQKGQYKLRGEWHDFSYYPLTQVHRIEAEAYDWEIDFERSVVDKQEEL